MNDILLDIPIGNAAAIGKIRLSPNSKIDHVMPVLHFIVLKEEGRYFGVCLELRAEGYGNTIESCAEDIKNGSFELIKSTFKYAENPIDAYMSIYMHEELDECMAKWWNAYRKIQLFFASKGKEFDTHSKLEDEIQRLKEKVAKLEAAQKLAANRESVDLQPEVFDLKAVA